MIMLNNKHPAQPDGNKNNDGPALEDA